MQQIRQQITANSSETWNIDFINVIFIALSFFMVIIGLIICFIETQLTIGVQKIVRYGKHRHKGESSQLQSILEVHKGWFSHFYIFALVWSLWSMYLVVQVLILHKELPKYAEEFLNYIGGGSMRKVVLNSTATVVVVCLMSLQCIRRWYETNFVQIFSNSGKINVAHYFVGYLHYFGVIAALLTNAEGFVPGSSPSALSFTQITLGQYFAIALFMFSWWQQYCSNIILVNLRKDTGTGKVVTKKHLMPAGGFFEFISSPHMFFEVLMYIALLAFLWKSMTWWLVVSWVASNQFVTALYTHQWYKDKFKDYPEQRRAIIPYIF